MRTSLTRLETIENFIGQTMPAEDRIVFSAQLLIDAELAADVRHQKETYRIVRRCSRHQMKSELEQMHRDLMTNNETFWNSILTIFQTN